jgi:hypothetical protein
MKILKSTKRKVLIEMTPKQLALIKLIVFEELYLFDMEGHKAPPHYQALARALCEIKEVEGHK